jgi:hypothetical protein
VIRARIRFRASAKSRRKISACESNGPARDESAVPRARNAAAAESNDEMILRSASSRALIAWSVL